MTKLRAKTPQGIKPSRPKIAVMGKYGVGKTWGLLAFPNTYYIDCEGGANLKHYIARLEKSGGVYWGAEDGASDFESVIQEVKALATVKHQYKTLVIDSLSKLFNAEITKEQERLGEKDGFGASKKPALRLSARLMYWIERADMNVVVVTHESAEWSNGQQIGTKPDAGDKLGHDLHLLLQIVKTGETRRAIIKKTRLLGFPDGESFEWSYEEFAKRYGKDIMEAETIPTQLATPEQVTEFKALLANIKLGDSAAEKRISDAAENITEVEADKIVNMIKYLKDKINPTPKGE